jgi:hypothetical protein
MKNQNMHSRRTIPAFLVVLVLGCFTLSPTVQADNDDGRSIIGLWRVHYSGDLVFNSFDQWFVGGLEWESADIAPGALCQGVFKQIARQTVKLFHVNWNYDQNGALIGYSYETQIDTLDSNGNAYHGTYDFKDYDVNGNLVSEEKGTLRGVRLSVP